MNDFGSPSRETIGRPMEILLVEDTLTFARITIGALKRGEFKHRLTWLRDGIEAVQFLKKEGRYGKAPRPDLVLLDLGLPGRDGREVLRDLRSDPALQGIPVVVLTGDTEAAEPLRDEGVQVEGYLTKPVDLDQFLELVNQLARYWQADMIVPGRNTP